MRSRPPSGKPGAPGGSGNAGRFEALAATALHCPRCRAAMPVRERLLLVLPDGELHEYLCARCLTSLGTRTVRGGRGPRRNP